MKNVSATLEDSPEKEYSVTETDVPIQNAAGEVRRRQFII